jgi:hypothetical protein
MQEERTTQRRSRVRARETVWAGRPGGPCAQCGDEVEHLEIDHIVPFFENGRHHLSNIQWLCHACHARKSAEEVRRHRVTHPHLYQRPMSEEGRKRVGDFFRGRTQPPELVEKRRQGMMRAWAKKSPEERAAVAEKIAEKNRGRKRGPMPEEQRRKIGEAQSRAWASGTRGQADS